MIDRKRYFVLARDHAQFIQWVQKTGVNLQACNPLILEESMQGISFTNPNYILVRLKNYTGAKSWKLRQAQAIIEGRYRQDRNGAELPEVTII